MSVFKLGLMLVAVGIIWISLVFVATEKTSDSVLLKGSGTIELKSGFTDRGFGFYKIYMPEFTGEAVFIQILDIKHNIIQEEVIRTKMSVGYFDFEEYGTYTIKVTNITDESVNIQIEFGNTNSRQMVIPGIIMVVGVIAMIIISYVKIKNYKIEQPDENIS